MGIFWTAFAAVAGILAPIVLAVVLVGIVAALVAAARGFDNRWAYRRAADEYLAGSSWVFERRLVCPNPVYVALTFRHSATEDRIELTCKKSELGL
jgi:hypothetical protein